MVKPKPGTTNTAVPFRFDCSGIKGITAGLSASLVPVAPCAPLGHKSIGSLNFCAAAVNRNAVKITCISKQIIFMMITLGNERKKKVVIFCSKQKRSESIVSISLRFGIFLDAVIIFCQGGHTLHTLSVKLPHLLNDQNYLL